MKNDFSSPRRMSAGAFVIIAMKTFKELAGAFFFIFVSLLFAPSDEQSFSETMMRTAILTGIIVALSLLVAFLKYYYRKFHINDDKLIFTHGIVFRQTTSIPLDKIHNLRTKKGLLYQVLDLRGVTFDTIANDQGDVELILSESDWFMLLSHVREGEKATYTKDATVPPPIATKDEIRKVSNSSILKGALCQNHLKGFSVLAACLAPVFNNLNELGSDTTDRIFDYIDTGASEYLSSAGQWLCFFAVVYLIVVVLLTARIMLRYGNMTITITGEKLTMSSGILSRYTCRLSRDKATVITIKQNPLEKIAGCKTITIGQASNASETKQWNEIRIYGSKLDEKVLDWWLNDSNHATEHPLMSAKSGKGVAVRKFIPHLLAAVVVTYVLVHFVGIMSLGVLIGSIYACLAGTRAIMAWKHSRITLNKSYIKLNLGNIARISNYMRYCDIESVEIKCSPFTRFTYRVSLRLYTNAETLSVYSLKIDSAVRLRNLILSQPERDTLNNQ